MAGSQIMWTRRAQQEMAALYKYISKDSPQNAHPECYNPDKHKKENDGTYRAFEIHRYRIVYRFHKNVIRVLRVRHTSMEPKKY